MRYLAYAGGALVALVLIMIAVGYMLPREHSASRERTYAVSPAALHAVITSHADFPSWRSDVKRVEALPEREGRLRFREIGTNGVITYVVEENIPERRVVTRIDDESLPFGGRWTHELIPVESGTTLRVTEDGEIYNPFFRFMSRFVLGYHRTMDIYLSDLDERLASK